MGFIFFRFRSGPQPSVAELLKPIEAEIAHYRVAEMVPSGASGPQKTPVNWKSVRDVDNEGYHVAMAHPALQDLYGATYFDEPFVNGVSRSFATYNPHAGRRWSVKNYVKIAPDPAHLPEKLQKAWLYYGIFPNMVIAVMPERCSSTRSSRCRRRRRCCAAPSTATRKKAASRRAARYLAYRIDRETMAEDVQLPSGRTNRCCPKRSAASICPISNMACAPIMTICAGWCR